MMKNLLTILLISCCGILSAQNYRIGDLYTAPDGSQGIVYYLLPDGSGGWVVALNDASTGCPWGTTTDVPGLTNLNPSYFYINLLIDTAGYANTQTIRSYQNNNTTYAAGVVDFVNGWYLPSLAQISMLYAQRPFIADAIIAAGGTNLAYDAYWCSDERDATYGWYIRNCGAFEPVDKTTHCRVRAVRSFSYDAPQLSYSWSTGANTQDITVTPTQTTTYAVTVSTPGGCADTVEHTIVVGVVSSSEFTISTETPYTWNGITYNQSGDYTQTFVNAAGCDSVVTMHLTITENLQVTITATDDTICGGDEVTLQVVTAGSSSNFQVPPIAVGDILCTDGTTVKPADYANSGKTAMGVVFYVDNTGAHGWAVHLHYQHIGIEWTTPMSAFMDIPTLTNYSTSRTAINDFDGYNNTIKIRNAGNAATYPAAYAVDFGNGWYIPAAGQLRQLFNEIVEVRASLQIVGGDVLSLDSSHWSSTEAGSNNVWDVRDRGTVYRNSKHSMIRLRSVRSF